MSWKNWKLRFPTRPSAKKSPPKTRPLVELLEARETPAAISYSLPNFSSANGIYRQDFNNLPTAGSTTPGGAGPIALDTVPTNYSMTGWQFQKTAGAATNAIISASDGTTSIEGINSFGISGERSLGSLAGPDVTSRFGVVLVNSSSQTYTSFTVSFVGEQWRRGNGAANSLAFSYAVGAGATDIGTGSFTPASSLNVTSPVTTGVNVGLDGNASANRVSLGQVITGITWSPGQNLVLRWDDVDNANNDDGLAIDDFAFIATPSNDPYPYVVASGGSTAYALNDTAVAIDPNFQFAYTTPPPTIHGVLIKNLNGVTGDIFSFNNTIAGNLDLGNGISANFANNQLEFVGDGSIATYLGYLQSVKFFSSSTTQGARNIQILARDVGETTLNNQNQASGDTKVVFISGSVATSAPQVTTHPSAQSVTALGNATFTASASGSPIPSVQWQQNDNGGGGFLDIPNATSNTLSLTNVPFSSNGYQYRAVFTNGIGSPATSNPAVLTVSKATPTIAITASGGVYTGSPIGPSAVSVNGVSGVITNNLNSPQLGYQYFVGLGAGGTPLGNTAPTGVGTYTVRVNWASNDPNYNSATNTATYSITPKALTITGLTANNKVFDNNTSATLSGTAVLSGVVSPDIVNLSGTPSGSFADAAIGNNKPVTVTGLSLTGGGASNYTLTPLTLTANITSTAPSITTNPTNATVTAFGSASFTAAATGSPTPSVQWRVSTDGGANYTDISGATGTTLNLSNIPFSSNNYRYLARFTNVGGFTDTTAATLTVNKATPTIALTAPSVVYDKNPHGVTAATVTGIASDTLATFGSGTLVYTYYIGTGTGGTNLGSVAPTNANTYTVVAAWTSDNPNYANATSAGTTFTISPKSLTVTGVTGVSRAYNGGTVASLIGSPTPVGVLSGDTVSITGSPIANFVSKNVANNITINVSGYTLGGASAGNYTLTQPTLSANITPAALTVGGTLAANSKTYDRLTTATLSGTAAPVGVFAPDVVTITGSPTASFANKNVANGKTVTVTGFTLAGGDAGNYTLTQPTLLTANITPATLTITGLSASNKVYNQLTNATITGTAALSGVILGDTVGLSGSATGTFADKNVANGKTVTVSGFSLTGADLGNYTLTQPTLTANITPLNLTITGVTANSRTYNALLPTTLSGTAALVGVISGDTVTVGGSPTAAFTTKIVGAAKPVTISGYTLGGTDAGNYTVSQPNTLTANVTAATLTINGVTANNKVFDNTTTATLTTAGATLVGVAGSDVVTLNSGSATGAFADAGIGTAKPVTASGFTISGADSTDYTLTQPTGLTANITNQTVTISGVTVIGRSYNGTLIVTLNTGSAALVGSPAGVTLVVSGATGTLADKNVGTNKPVTVSGFSLTGPNAGNYTLVQPTGLTANITAASLTISGLTASNKVYNGNATATLAGTATLVGVFAPDVVTLGGSPSANFANKTVANGKAVTVTGYALAGAEAGNYTVVQPTGLTANVTALNLTISGVTANNKVFNNSTNATLTTAGATLVTPIGGDVVSLNSAGATASFADPAVGTGKPVTAVGFALAGSDAGNYTLSQPTGLTADITNQTLTISGVTAISRVYNGTVIIALNTASAALVGLPAGVTLVSSGASGTVANKNVGTAKPVTVTGFTITGANASNYTLVQPTGLTANITALGLTISGLTANNKTYNGNVAATLSGTATLVTPIGGDTVSLAGAPTANFANKTVGTGKAVTVAGYTLAGADAGNYTLTQPTGLTANITAAALTITGRSANNKVYDNSVATTLSGTAALSGVIAPDSVILGGTPVASFADKNVGTAKTVTVTGYTISGVDAANYTLTQPSYTANITALALTISGLSAGNKVYNSTAAATLSGTASLVGILGGDIVSLIGSPAATFNNKNVGNAKPVTVSGYALTGAGASNYSLTAPSLAANITPAPLSVTGVVANHKVYDGLTTATLAGTAAHGVVFGGDVVSLGGAPTANFADKNVGTGKAVTVTGYTISGTDAGNYAHSQPIGLTANITARALTIGGVLAVDKIFDSTTTATLNTASATLVGVVSPDVVTLSSASAAGAFADAVVGNNKPVTVTGFTIAGAGASNYTVTQPAGLTANIIQNLTATTTLLTVTNVGPSTGNMVNLVATVSPTPTGPPPLSLSFYNGGVLLGTVNMTGNSASLNNVTLAPGSNVLRAVFSGNSFFATSSDTKTVSTGLKATSITVASSSPTVATGVPVTFTATVTSAQGMPEGAVTFYRNGVPIAGQSPLPTLVNGRATFSVVLPAGSHSITASYGGNSAFAGSSSPAITQAVGGSVNTNNLANIRVTTSGKTKSTVVIRNATSSTTYAGGFILQLPSTTTYNYSLSSAYLYVNGVRSGALTIDPNGGNPLIRIPNAIPAGSTLPYPIVTTLGPLGSTTNAINLELNFASNPLQSTSAADWKLYYGQ